MWRIPKQSSVQNSAIHSWKNVSCTIQIKEINVAAPLLEENIRFSGRHDTVFRMASWRQVEQTEATQAGPRHLSHSLRPHLPHLVPAPVCKVMLLEEPPLTLPINTTPFSSLSRICSCAYYSLPHHKWRPVRRRALFSSSSITRTSKSAWHIEGAPGALREWILCLKPSKSFPIDLG